MKDNAIGGPPNEIHTTDTTPPLEQQVSQEDEDIELQVDNDPDVVQALQDLENWRKNPDNRSELDLVADVRKAREAAKERLTGTDNNRKELLDIQAKRKLLDTILNTINGEEDDSEILQKLGFVDENGKFSFPEKIFSQRAKELYDKYLELIVIWQRANEQSALLGVDVDEMKYLDKARTMAHDQATQQICDEMNGALGFQQVRRLIAKMRDNLVPNAGESQSTALAARKALEKAAQDVYAREAELKKEAA